MYKKRMESGRGRVALLLQFSKGFRRGGDRHVVVRRQGAVVPASHDIRAQYAHAVRGEYLEALQAALT